MIEMTHPFSIVLIGIAGCDELAIAACELTHATWSTAPERLSPEQLNAEVVVIGPEAGEPLRLAGEVRQQNSDAVFVFLLATEAIAAFQRRLPFARAVEPAWTVETSATPAALAEVLHTAAAAALQKRQAQLVKRRINARLDAVSSDEQSARELRQLAISQRYLSTLLAQAPDAFIAISSSDTILAWNRTAESLFGWSAEEAFGRTIDEIFEQTPTIRTLLLSLPRDRETEGQEIRLGSADDERWVECNSAPVIDADGQLLSLSVNFHDTTRRQLAERRLRESELRYRTLTETLPQLVWTCRPDGYCDYMSSQWDVYTRVPDTARLGFGWLTSVLHPDDRERTFSHWMGAVEGKHPYDLEYRLRRNDGVWRWFKVRGTAVYTTAGTTAYWFGTCTDIQDIVEARELLARSAGELEQRVADEVARRSLAEEALRQAQKMEAVGQLTGGLAHDFNNILQGIVGSLGLLQRRIEKGQTADLERLVGNAIGSANRASALIHRLLAFSRRQPLDPRPTNANALINGMHDLIVRTVGEQIHCDLMLADDLWLTRCDAHQLESAVLNLVINARDAMPDGGRLCIETTNVCFDKPAQGQADGDMAPGEYVLIGVTDTGSGMSPAVLAQAVEPFFTTKPIGQGSGLGLSMIYGFARQSHGYLTLYSEEGRGTSVKLYLPCMDEPAAVEPAIPLPEPQAARGERVLVVEDEEVVRHLVLAVLAELGYEAIAAHDGPSALAVLEADRGFDLLITDIGLPGLNGRQVAETARNWQPQLKVLYMTGYAEKAAMSSGFLRANMTLISKPFAVDALATRIRTMLEQ